MKMLINDDLKQTVFGNTKSPPVKRRHPRLRAHALALVAMGIVASASGAASAAETTFIGYTDGCFGAATCTPPTTPTTGTQTITFGGLTYNNSTFDVTTSAGFVSVGAFPTSPNVDNLGSFSLSGAPFDYSGGHFLLRVTFTAPPATVPGNTVFTDILSGTVMSVDNGGAFVNFDNTPQHFTFGSGASAGAFDFFVNDLSVTAGRSVAVTGVITAVNAVPEPETYAMMMAGLGLLGLMGRRKKRNEFSAE